jgi:hypothetical protein
MSTRYCLMRKVSARDLFDGSLDEYGPPCAPPSCQCPIIVMPTLEPWGMEMGPFGLGGVKCFTWFRPMTCQHETFENVPHIEGMSNETRNSFLKRQFVSI